MHHDDVSIHLPVVATYHPQHPASHSCSSAKQCTVSSNSSHGKRSAQSMSHHFELQNLFRAHGSVCDSNQSCLSVICFWSVWSVLHIDASSFHTHLVLACFSTKKVQKVCHIEYQKLSEYPKVFCHMPMSPCPYPGAFLEQWQVDKNVAHCWVGRVMKKD